MPREAPLTHFLCIPLKSSQLARTLASFRNDVTSPLSFAIPQDAVRPLGTLHLTLGVMSLKSEEVLSQAVALLKSLPYSELLSRAREASAASALGAGTSKTVAEGAKLAITLQGLHAIGAASKASVFYAPPRDEDGILYRFCETIRAAFLNAGLLKEENRPLLLHATIINTVYVRSTGQRGKRRERLTLDGRDIISRYEDYVWMEDMVVDRIAIYRMGAKKIPGTDDEAYEVEAEVDL